MKNRNTALILCIFGEPFGIHKFYEGNIAMGIVYLCTAGLFFIGWVVDIIKYIAMKEERYNPEKAREDKKEQRMILQEKMNAARIENMV